MFRLGNPGGFMKRFIVLVMATVILAGCQSAPAPSICSDQTNPVAGESLIPKPTDRNEALAEAATICALRACRFSELAYFEYRGTKSPKISYWTDQNQQGVGRCIYPKYYQYRDQARKAGIGKALGSQEKTPTNTEPDLATVCPGLTSSIAWETRATRFRHLNGVDSIAKCNGFKQT